MPLLLLLAATYSACFAKPEIQRADVRVPCQLDITAAEGLTFDLAVEDISEFSNIYCYVGVTGGNHWLRLKPLRRDGKPERITIRKTEFEGKEDLPTDWKVNRLSLACIRAGLKGSTLSVENIQPLKQGARRWISSLSDPHHLGGIKTWEEGAKALKAAGWTDLVIGPERADRYPELGDPIAACHKHGLKCHAYFIVFSRPWERKYGDNFLNPADPKAQQEALDTLKGYLQRGFDGIGLDYIRYSYDQQENKKFGGVKSEVITAFVKRVREMADQTRPGVEITASVFETPSMGHVVGQDWGTWLDRGYVDFIKPMIYYCANETFYANILDQIKRQAPKSWKKVVPMIGIREWPQLGAAHDRARYRAQRDLILSAGFDSYSVYQLEPRILEAIK